MVRRATELVESRYLRIEDFDVATAWLEAAEAVEAAVPWLIVEGDDHGGISLRRGQEPPFANLTLTGDDIEALEAALVSFQLSVEVHPQGIPEGVDLSVELLRGVSRALDRHSVVLARKRLARFDERIKGKLSGIGARIGLVDGEPTIKETFIEGPARLSGLRQGDVVLRVDGFSTVGMRISQVVGLIRGPVDTEVRLRIRRDGAGGPQELEMSLTRAEVAIPNLSWHMRPSGVGVVAIEHFSEQSATLLHAALTELSASSDPPLRGLAVDLRGNSGGSMTQACRVTDMFIANGVVLQTGGRNGSPVRNLLREFRAHPEKIEPQVPIFVLMDRSSASASEIVAGAMIELDRGALVGTRSFGKGTVQKLYTLRSGDDQERVRFKLTVAEYLVGGTTPIISGVGLEPDLLVEAAEFVRGGVSLPIPANEDQASLVYANELVGWREGVTLPEASDYLLELVDDAAARAEGIDRTAALAALESVHTERLRSEQERMEEVFAHRDLDWRQSDESGDVPHAQVEIELVDRPLAGNKVEVRAVVRNLGDAPLYQVRVHLSASDRYLPWHELTLPVGFLPPGEDAIGSAVALIAGSSPSRADEVAVTLVADQRPTLGTEPALLQIEERERPPMSLRARLVPMDDHHRVELTLSHASDVLLTGLRSQLSWHQDAPYELIDARGQLQALPPDQPGRIDMAVRIAPEVDTLDLDLKVEAEVFGTILDMPVALPVDGSVVALEPPRVRGYLPTLLPHGPATLNLELSDDTGLHEVLVWSGSDKVRWDALSGTEAELAVPVTVGPGTQRYVVQVEDQDGIVTRRTWYVYGIDGEDAADDGTVPTVDPG